MQDSERNNGRGADGAPPAVAMRGITKRFPGVVANDGVDFEAAVGEVHALLGENGAGKSTLSNILTGLYRPDEGEIFLRGRHVHFHAPRDALDAGIFMVHQHFRLVEPFTVAENVVLGDHRGAGRSFRLRRRAIERRVGEVARSYGMQLDPRARIWQLSLGEQQRVEIVKALYRDANILILDEPTAVLTPQEADVLFTTLRAMAEMGRTVIFISHKLHEVKAVADRVTVLRGGRAIATVAIEDATPRSLAALMVGTRARARASATRSSARRRRRSSRRARLCADDDRGRAALKDVSLNARAGEIVGDRRSRRERAARARRDDRGPARADGRPRVRLRPRAARGDPRAAIAAGVAYVPEDRLGTGLAPSLSIASNLALKSYRARSLSRGPLLRLRAIRDRAVELISRYRIAAPGPDAQARQLSGGNLQKVVLAREFTAQPRLIVAASPTRGLDVGAIETVHAYLRDAAAEGVAVLLISEDLDEILALADRIAVMYEGAILGELDAANADVEEIGLLMAGGHDPRED